MYYDGRVIFWIFVFKITEESILDWQGLIVNIIAIFAGLFVYIGIANTKWGREHEEYQYAFMLASVLGACIVGGLLRAFF